MPIEHDGILWPLPLPKQDARYLNDGDVAGEQPEQPKRSPADDDPESDLGTGLRIPAGDFDPNVDDQLELVPPFAPDEVVDPAEVVIEAEQIVGPYDAWLGVVGMVHTAGTNTLSSYKQEIFVSRVGVHFQTNNDPQGYAVPTVASQLTPAGVTALPWPVRHDQAEYLVKQGDIVTVLTGRDGRHYYMVDDLPFLAIVVSHLDANYTVLARQNDPPTTAYPGERYLVGTTGTGAWSALSENVVEWSGAAWSSTETPDSDVIVYASGSDDYWEGDGAKFDSKAVITKEINAGGAGVRTIKVVRQALAGNPGEKRFGQIGFSDLQDASSGDILYANVIVIRAWSTPHGYRVDDPVWVFRRGQYWFCQSANNDAFVGRINIAGASSGPDGESDFATNHYWVREQGADITYTNNQYAISSWGDVLMNATSNPALPRSGRWVDAVNLAESTDSHGLTHNELIVVTTMYESTGTATSISDKGLIYVFYRVPMTATTSLITNGILYWDGTKIASMAAPSDEEILKWTVASGFEWIADPS